MFIKTSRYYKIAQTETKTKAGRTLKVLKLRRLPITEGVDTSIKDNDRLDIIAQRLYDIPTRFWHAADANTELQANDLVSEVGRTIKIPEK